MMEIPFLSQIITAVVVIVAVYVGLKLGKKALFMVINGVLGLLGLLAFNSLPFAKIEVNLASILIAGFGGLFGIAILAILATLGIKV